LKKHVEGIILKELGKAGSDQNLDSTASGERTVGKSIVRLEICLEIERDYGLETLIIFHDYKA